MGVYLWSRGFQAAVDRPTPDLSSADPLRPSNSRLSPRDERNSEAGHFSLRDRSQTAKLKIFAKPGLKKLSRKTKEFPEFLTIGKPHQPAPSLFSFCVISSRYGLSRPTHAVGAGHP
ncbi:hypothetical protein RRG08_009791 [Elysia crispata]|uniref:Uncharacterized protein n=1 Tax=Elysia crispata TaxID=231223 RepID=A0AAE0ZQQ4_9GAST|nr:hypothetical protein RRG08_009791 [Elysia crispata]